jgi:glutamate/tyrosine decarboxylase-like PLP-dependent enzyme
VEADELVAALERQLKPYRGELPSFPQLPEDGVPRAEVAGLIERLAAAEESRWRNGYASGAVYHGDPDHVAFLNRVYAAQSQSNPLHPDLWPSATKFEAEIVAMTADMLGARHADPAAPVAGTVSSGGTESILLAMKTYRDFARARRGIAEPEIVAPVTAHAAFDKAARYFDMTLVRVGVDAGFKADLAAMADAITERTAVVVGSAPTFPHGIIDPIPEIAALAAERGAGCHVDACLGGFIVPWAEKLGYPVPPFDFRLPGVTSMSADTHKYGYAAKGSSVVLYRGRNCGSSSTTRPPTGPVACTCRLRSPGAGRARCRPPAGRPWSPSARTATPRRPAASWRPGRRCATASRRSPASGCSATRCGSSRSPPRTAWMCSRSWRTCPAGDGA